MLKESISIIRTQTRKPDGILVVNNGNDERTINWLSEQNDLIVINQENTGSEGGFKTILKTGYNLGFDWIMTIDDDIYLEPDCIEKICSVKYINDPSTGFLSCRVVNKEGKTYMTPGPILHHWEYYDTLQENSCIQIDGGTWAGLVVSREALKKVGLPISEFFLWDGDIEFTQRISKKMPCYLVINSVIKHFQEDDNNKKFKIKYLYLSRNRFARIQISDMSFFKKVVKTIKAFKWLIYYIAIGKFPLSSFLWALKGIFTFRPKIEMV
jgi:GT2 family glycosyltransferase